MRSRKRMGVMELEHDYVMANRGVEYENLILLSGQLGTLCKNRIPNAVVLGTSQYPTNTPLPLHIGVSN